MHRVGAEVRAVADPAYQHVLVLTLRLLKRRVHRPRLAHPQPVAGRAVWTNYGGTIARVPERRARREILTGLVESVHVCRLKLTKLHRCRWELHHAPRLRLPAFEDGAHHRAA